MTEIDTRITPSLHPANVAQVEGYDEDTKQFLAPVESAFTEAYVGLGSVWDAKVAATNDPTLTPAAQLLRVDQFSHGRLLKITQTFDSVSASVDRSMTSIEADLSKPIEARAAHTVATEIRSYVRGLETGARMTLIQQAIDQGDHTTATAVLGAPAYLSGLDANMQNVLVRQYHEKANPVQAKRLKALQGAKSLLEKNAPLALSEMSKAVGFITDPKTSRRIYPDELRKQKGAADKPFAA